MHLRPDADTAESRADRPGSGIEWTIWFQWVLATTLGWLGGWALLGDPGIGATVGLGQWLVLRGLVRQASWWIPASTIGWLAGWLLVVSGIIIPPNASGLAAVAASMVLGLAAGLGQWLVLRRQLRQAGWWIPASTVGWMVGLTGFLGITLVGAVVGALTGFMLDWLLRYSHLEE